VENDKNDYSGSSNRLFSPVLGALGFLAMLGILSYLGYKIGDIEERIENGLEYKPPASSASASEDVQPVFTTRHAHTIYVPVYSHIYAMGGTPVLLETTLSIRNTDPEKAILINSIAYFDTKGNKIEEYLDGDLALGPLASTEVLVEKRDIRGGSGANFMVKWNADKPVHLPIVEAIMIGGEGDLRVSFRSNGRPLTSRIDPIVQ
jgi:hypothetical protein